MKPRDRWRLARRRRRPRRGVLKFAVFLIALFLVVLAVIGPATIALAISPLPSVENVSTNSLPQDVLLYDRNGALIGDIGQQGNHRVVVPISGISPAMIQATIAIEDRSFYSNSGIDFGAIARAAFDDLLQRRVVEGGSTITQQLVKQIYFGTNAPETLDRKLREAALAVAVTRRYSKDQVLDVYLNTIYYGNQAYGVEAAAQTYFHTSAAKLTLAQAALLAGIPQAPSAYNPVLYPKVAQQRRTEVLAAMVRQGNINQKEADLANATPVTVYPPESQVQAPHFVDYVLGILRDRYHILPGDGHGYRVTTTLDLGLQKQAESIIHSQIARYGSYYNFHDASLVSMDPKTGEILAMVGSADYNAPGGRLNLATDPTRQVGSAFKIFTYTAAIESQRVNMDTPVLDEPLTFPIGGTNNGPYAPKNYDQQTHGLISLQEALGNSLNIPALKVELFTGISNVLAEARKMGATSLTKDDSYYGPSLTLGAYPVSVLDMAVSTSTLADMGVRHDPSPILKITDAAGHDAFDLDPNQSANQAVSPQAAFVMASMLSNDQNRCLEFGCGGLLTLPDRTVAAKTGTSEGFRDNWTLGFTPNLTTVVWVGNTDNKPLSHNSTGIVGAAPIWHQFMVDALKGKAADWYNAPDNLEQFGSSYYIAGTEDANPSLLSDSWPTCPQSSYPQSTSWSDIMVDGVPCALAPPSTNPFDGILQFFFGNGRRNNGGDGGD